MYSANYFNEDGHIKIPENYSGTSMLEEKTKEEAPAVHIEIPKAEMKVSPKEETHTAEEVFFKAEDEPPKNDGGFDLSAVFRSFSIKDVHIGKILPKIGTEELLLIALAAFLLFSKNGDKECALLVFLLIFVK